MKFSQIFSDSFKNNIDANKESNNSKWISDLHKELIEQREYLLKQNIKEHKEFKKLLNAQKDLKNSIDDIEKELSDNSSFEKFTEEETRIKEEQLKEFKNLSSSLENNIEKLTEGNLSAINDIKNNLNNSNLPSNNIDFDGLNKDLSKQTNMISQGVSNLLGKGASGIISKMGASSTNPYIAIGQMIFTGISWGVKGAISQITELNDSMISLERETGGVLTANKLQMDFYGNMKDSFGSLRTAAIKANISVEEITGKLKEFAKVDGGFGMFLSSKISGNMIKGTGGDTKTQSDLKTFGIESAKINKLYNTNIVPAVQGMFKDWGYSVEDASNSMIDGVRTMRLEGLSPEEWVNGMASLVKMSGKLTFKNGAKTMSNLVSMATKLGTSVENIANGFSEMKGFTDVFERQADMSALGMQNYGKELGKIYALRKAGKHDEASALEISSLATDLKSKGLTDYNTGEITQQGIEFMDAMGLSQEQIQAMQQATKLATQGMKKYGWTLKDALKPMNQLTDSQRKQAEQLEKNNITIKEGIDRFKKNMEDQVFKRIAILLIPLVEKIASLGMFGGVKTTAEQVKEKTQNLGLTEQDLIKIYNKENPNNQIDLYKKQSDSFVAKLIAKQTGKIPESKLLNYKSKNKKEIGIEDLGYEKQTELGGIAEVIGGWDNEKQIEYYKSLGKTKEEVEKFTKNLNETNKNLEKQVQLQEDEIKAKNKLHRDYIAQNISSALDRAMRDLVTYGKVGKSPNIQSLESKFQEVQKNQQIQTQQQNNTNVIIKNDSNLASVSTSQQ